MPRLVDSLLCSDCDFIYADSHQACPTCTSRQSIKLIDILKPFEEIITRKKNSVDILSKQTYNQRSLIETDKSQAN